MTIKESDFVPEMNLPIYYIYKIDRKTDNSIDKVHFYAYDEKQRCFTSYNASVDWISRQLSGFKSLAYCGHEISQNGTLYFSRVGIVIPMIKDGKHFITTISDDSKSNNLVSLDEVYSI